MKTLTSIAMAVLIVSSTVACTKSAAERSAEFKKLGDEMDARRKAAEESDLREFAEKQKVQQAQSDEESRRERALKQRADADTLKERIRIRSEEVTAQYTLATNAVAEYCADKSELAKLTARIRADQDQSAHNLRRMGLDVDENGLIRSVEARKLTAAEVSRMDLEQTTKQIKQLKERYNSENARVDKCRDARLEQLRLENQLALMSGK